MPHDVFISYSNVDAEAARTIYDRLKAQQIRCWMAPEDILGGMTWEAAIMAAIKECRVMVLVFSAHSNESADVLKEVRIAVRLGRPVIPVRVQDVPASDVLEYHIAGWQWVDAFVPPLDRHIGRLVASIRALLPAPPTTIEPTPPPAEETPAPPSLVADGREQREMPEHAAPLDDAALDALPDPATVPEQPVGEPPVVELTDSRPPSRSRRPLIMSGVTLALLVLSGTAWLLSRPTADSTVVTHIGSGYLSAQRLGELLGNAKIGLLTTRQNATMIAEQWATYQRIGYAAADGDSLSDSKLVDSVIVSRAKASNAAPDQISLIIAEAGLQLELARLWDTLGVDPKTLTRVQANDPTIGPNSAGREFIAERRIGGMIDAWLSGGADRRPPVSTDLQTILDKKYPMPISQLGIDRAVTIAQRIRASAR